MQNIEQEIHRAGVFPSPFYDVPSQVPLVTLSLDRVAIFNQQIPLTFFDDLFGEVKALFHVKAGLALRAEQRGIHMSRIEQAFQKSSEKQALPELVLDIARSIRQMQEQEHATLRLWGDIILPQATAVSHLTSHDLMTVHAHAITGEKEEVSFGLETTIITACPCMQAYTLDEMVRMLNISFEDPQSIMRSIPIATHSQKGRVSLIISGTPESVQPLSFRQIYQILDKGTCLTSELLKRPDEYALVRKAHLKPQFVEDVVRDILAQTALALENEDASLKVFVRAQSYESIHGHDIEAEAETTLDQLQIRMKHLAMTPGDRRLTSS